jgi:D-sedoheptulose 7-phosphate isomerase
MKINFKEEICAQIKENIDTSKRVLSNCLDEILDAAYKVAGSIKKGNKVMLCGNGGSAADSAHIAAEFVNRFKKERRPLPAVSLVTDTSVLTSISNDYDFGLIFSKQVEAIGKKGDILIAISTSGNAENVLNAVCAGRKIGIFTICLTGDGGGKINELADICIKIPSQNTPRIQEAHILAGHLICDITEKILFSK